MGDACRSGWRRAGADGFSRALIEHGKRLQATGLSFRLRWGLLDPLDDELGREIRAARHCARLVNTASSPRASWRMCTASRGQRHQHPAGTRGDPSSTTGDGARAQRDREATIAPDRIVPRRACDITASTALQGRGPGCAAGPEGARRAEPCGNRCTIPTEAVCSSVC